MQDKSARKKRRIEGGEDEHTENERFNRHINEGKKSRNRGGLQVRGMKVAQTESACPHSLRKATKKQGAGAPLGWWGRQKTVETKKQGSHVSMEGLRGGRSFTGVC